MKNIAVIYKKSLYRIYFLERGSQVARSRNQFTQKDIARLQASHLQHEAAMEQVLGELRRRKLRFRPIYRARHLNYSRFDFVISVGGDGTFLEAARRMTTQTILGVNSNPDSSAGALCATDATHFAGMLDAIQAGTAHCRKLNRIAMRINGTLQEIPALNDILVAHEMPAALTRYRFVYDGKNEIHRNSGLWVCTAAGSTGAMHSAGGREMPLGSRRVQYRPREMCQNKSGDYHFTGGFLSLTKENPLKIISMTRNARVFVDGPHVRFPLPFGAELEVINSPHPLRTVIGPGSANSAKS